jgi:drug/metabolite transporter (DMT)-like permease
MMKKMAAVNVIILLLVSVMLGAFGQLSMKKGLKNKPIQINELASLKVFNTVFEPNVFLGILLYIAATLIWLVVLSNAELSYAYPLIALGYIVTTVFSYIYLGENIVLYRWLGIILIVVGAILIGRT